MDISSLDYNYAYGKNITINRNAWKCCGNFKKPRSDYTLSGNACRVMCGRKRGFCTFGIKKDCGHIKVYVSFILADTKDHNYLQDNFECKYCQHFFTPFHCETETIECNEKEVKKLPLRIPWVSYILPHPVSKKTDLLIAANLDCLKYCTASTQPKSA